MLGRNPADDCRSKREDDNRGSFGVYIFPNTDAQRGNGLEHYELIAMDGLDGSPAARLAMSAAKPASNRAGARRRGSQRGPARKAAMPGCDTNGEKTGMMLECPDCPFVDSDPGWYPLAVANP
jgi:hypothetical protein